MDINYDVICFENKESCGRGKKNHFDSSYDNKE